MFATMLLMMIMKNLDMLLLQIAVGCTHKLCIHTDAGAHNCVMGQVSRSFSGMTQARLA